MTERSDEYRRAAETRRTQMESQQQPPRRAAMGDIEERQRIPGTSSSVRIGDWRGPALTTAAAAAPDLAGHNVPLAAAAVAATEVVQRYRRLDDAERAVYDLLERLAQGGSIYRVWIDENELVDAMDPELDLDARRRLLANMRSRDLLEEAAGKWRAVR